MKKISFGFTLIELLVVIAVIGLLASIILVATNPARIRARDVRRKADLAQIAKALEFYYDKYGGYPASACSSDVACSTCGPGCAGYVLASSLAQQTKFQEFMPSAPHDPKYPNVDCYNTEYVYISDSYRSTALATKYVLYATLEDQSTTNLNPISVGWNYDYQMINAWPCAGYGTVNYRVGFLQ